MLVTSFGLGIVIGFVFFEISGLTAGGIIVPGYLALFVHEPLRILATLFVSLLTYGCIYLLAQRSVVFGRRRFFLVILLGFILRSGFDYFSIYLPESGVELQAIGYIIPGLIANEFYRQGVLKTLLAMTIVVILVYFLLEIIYP
jgi:poly-gamma-glutamate biosynthesis protein PgsC/CapC